MTLLLGLVFSVYVVLVFKEIFSADQHNMQTQIQDLITYPEFRKVGTLENFD